MTPIEAAEADITALAEKVGDGELDRNGDALQIEAELKRIVQHSGATVDACKRMFEHKVKSLVIVTHDRSKEDLDEVDKAARRAEAWSICKHIARSPQLLERLCDVGYRLGVVGDRRGFVQTYGVMTSRLLSSPVASLRTGSSSSGKNVPINAGLKLFPDDEIYRLTSASPKALLYSPRDLRHRVVIIAEAEALAPNTRGVRDELAMFVRELLSSGRLIHQTVQPVGPKGELDGIEKEKEGPVALLVTSARPVEEELATRLLVTVTDESPAQTRRILAAQAEDAAGRGPSPLSKDELTVWQAFQMWLKYGPRKVVIPFARKITDRIDVRAQRIRRDNTQVLSLTKAFALICQHNRAIDAEGRIIATRFDYALAIATLGEGLDEQDRGDTTAIDAVRAAVARALAQERRQWGRDAMLASFVAAYVANLAAHQRHPAVRKASLWRKDRAGADTIASFEGFMVAAGFPALSAADRLKLWRQAVKNARQPSNLGATTQTGSQPSGSLDHNQARPSCVPLPSRALARILGIGHSSARDRLAAAIEAGVVLDVTYTVDPRRARTAPRLLQPGRDTAAPVGRHGAFPAASALT